MDLEAFGAKQTSDAFKAKVLEYIKMDNRGQFEATEEVFIMCRVPKRPVGGLRDVYGRQTSPSTILVK